jgi:hypothetical protein
MVCLLLAPGLRYEEIARCCRAALFTNVHSAMSGGDLSGTVGVIVSGELRKFLALAGGG